MKVVIAGGAGWLGSALRSSLSADGHDVVVLSRSGPPGPLPSGARKVTWGGRSVGAWADELEGADAVVNLAGESIAGKRWSPTRKGVLRQSRIEPTEVLVAAMRAAGQRPRALVNASAVGYYGDRSSEPALEEDPPGSDFLAQLCVDWEAAARQAEALGVRVALMRIGIVLGSGGGALPRLALPYRLFVGGPLGTGRQWVSWVHIDDVVGLFRFAIESSQVAGPVNVTAPKPITMSIFAESLGRAMGRPAWFRVPPVALKLALGELGGALLKGQRAVPAVADRLGYGFREPDLDRALRRALGRPL
jgi:uncharacterized protein (TIGR01777 family)